MLSVVEQVIMPQTKRGSTIDTNGSAGWGWEHQWKWQGPNNDVGLPQSGNRNAHPFWIGRGSGMMADVQRKVAAAGHVRIYDDTWIVDQREPVGSVDAYVVEEREPSVLEWLFIDGTEPMRQASSQPDPWLTWEYRTHLDQSAFEPTATPVTLDQMRIAHNVALSKNDAVTAEKWREQIEAQIDRTVVVKFDKWVRLIGVRLIGGVQPRLESWFEVTDAPSGDVQWNVSSSIIAQGEHSLIPVDKTDRAMAFPPSLPTKLWRTGYIYKTTVVLNHRIGVERYVGGWASRDGASPPQRIDHKPDTTLVTLE